MAPEVVKKRQYTTKLDIWALGITVIELCDGDPPYADMNPLRVMFSIPHRQPPTGCLHMTNPWYLVMEPTKRTSIFLEFLSKCLIKEPTDRADCIALLQHEFVANIKGATILKDFFATQKVIICKIFNKFLSRPTLFLLSKNVLGENNRRLPPKLTNLAQNPARLLLTQPTYLAQWW